MDDATKKRWADRIRDEAPVSLDNDHRFDALSFLLAEGWEPPKKRWTTEPSRDGWELTDTREDVVVATFYVLAVAEEVCEMLNQRDLNEATAKGFVNPDAMLSGFVSNVAEHQTRED